MINLAIYYITKSKYIKSESNKNINQNYYYPNAITLEKHLKYNFSYTVTYLKKVLIVKIHELRKINSNISCYNFISFIKSHWNNIFLLSFVLLFCFSIYYYYYYYSIFIFIFIFLLLLFFPITLFVFEFKVLKLDLYSDVQFYLFRMCSIHHS